jgi:hypothetical protein
MAEQRRRATGSRPAAGRRAADRRAAARSRSRRRVGWLIPLLTVTAGTLMAGSQLTPALLEVTASTSPAAAPTAAAVPTPAAARAVPLAGSAASRASVAAEGGLAIPQPPRPQQIAIMPNAALGTPPAYSPRPDACGGAGTTPRRMVPGVVAGVGAATLDWMSDNRPEVLGYRVQAVSQRLVGGEQPAPVTQDVAQPAGCVPVSATITGLTPGEPYVFWLEEQVTSASTGVTRLVQVGTTSAVVIG